MRIVIDMQGAQTESRFRGIGGYTLGFAQGVVRHRGEHEIILALSGLFPETIESIRTAFHGLLPQENILVWHAPGPVAEINPGNEGRREIAELIREAFIASLKPDIVHICSLFEGHEDDAVTSIGRFEQASKVSVTLYDLIPLLNPEHYLKPNPRYAEYYGRKIQFMKKVAICLAISEFSRQEGLQQLDGKSDWIVNVGTAIGSEFHAIQCNDVEIVALRKKFSIIRPFVLYTGGADERKNFPRLIQAYAALPDKLRGEHQLLFVGKISEGGIADFRKIAQSAGLRPDELCFTGYVTEKELIQLYNTCKLFVFPSWHEGFGLPVLEAMACGAPVICSNTTSLPEVMGLDAALFDPFDIDSITSKMSHALQDDDFRAMLCEHGLRQAKLFSWDETAKKAISAWESLLCSQEKQKLVNNESRGGEKKPTLAFVSPLPPERTGIADYGAVAPALTNKIAEQAANFFPAEADLARTSSTNASTLPLPRPEKRLFLDISVVCREDYKTGIQRVVRALLLALLKTPPAGFRIEPICLSDTTGEWQFHTTRRHTQTLLQCSVDELDDRVVAPQNGDVLLGLDLTGPFLIEADRAGLFANYRNKGVHVYFIVYDLLPVLMPDFFPPRASECHIEWLRAISKCDGAVCISKTVANDLVEWRKASGYDQAQQSPYHISWFHLGADVSNSAPSKGLPDDACQKLRVIRERRSFLMVGTIEPRKGHWQVIQAFEQLWQDGVDINLVIVGKEGWKGLSGSAGCNIPEILKKLRTHPEHDKRLFWLESISDEYLEKIYAASTCLIAASYGEGFGLPLIEAAQHRLPIIARDIPVFREVSGEHAFYFGGLQPEDLARALLEWLKLFDSGQAPSSRNMPWFTWEQSAKQLLQRIPLDPELVCDGLSDEEQLRIAQCLAKTFRPSGAKKQLLVDISELVQTDAKSGIQRVVRSILAEWLSSPPKGYRVEPVYATLSQPYRYARRFTAEFLGETDGALEDDLIEYWAGDVFFGLDLQPVLVPAHRFTYQSMRRQGVCVKFMLHDLLCVQMPECFLPGASEGFTQWLEVVAENDGAVCVSKSSAEDFSEWVRANVPEREESLEIDWSHNGADVDNSVPTKGLPSDAENILAQIRERPGFLMVGTLEPRKGHAQVLAAFERLWMQDEPVNLVIVGKQGWLVDELAEKLRSHPENGKRLFWLKGISDEYLEKVYAASRCLIAASYAEGFGLPLVEAARHKVPIIARDIAVFREVAGKHAYYFSDKTPEGLADAIKAWLALYAQNQHPVSDNMPWLTWKESAQNLLNFVGCGGAAHETLAG